MERYIDCAECGERFLREDMRSQVGEWGWTPAYPHIRPRSWVDVCIGCRDNDHVGREEYEARVDMAAEEAILASAEKGLLGSIGKISPGSRIALMEGGTKADFYAWFLVQSGDQGGLDRLEEMVLEYFDNREVGNG